MLNTGRSNDLVKFWLHEISYISYHKLLYNYLQIQLQGLTFFLIYEIGQD